MQSGRKRSLAGKTCLEVRRIVKVSLVGKSIGATGRYTGIRGHNSQSKTLWGRYSQLVRTCDCYCYIEKHGCAQQQSWSLVLSQLSCLQMSSNFQPHGCCLVKIFFPSWHLTIPFVWLGILPHTFDAPCQSLSTLYTPFLIITLGPSAKRQLLLEHEVQCITLLWAVGAFRKALSKYNVVPQGVYYTQGVCAEFKARWFRCDLSDAIGVKGQRVWSLSCALPVLQCLLGWNAKSLKPTLKGQQLVLAQ